MYSNVAEGRNTRSGYHGKSSEVTWLTKAAQELARDGSDGEGDRSGSVAGESASAAVVRDSHILSADMTLETPTYHLDDLDISVVGDQIDPFALPRKQTADALVKSYFDTVHPLFPILLKDLFSVQYESFYKFPFTPESSKRWLAILNALFAIGAVYTAQVGRPNFVYGDPDHTQYFARARVLSLDGGVVFEVADLQQIQVAGLMGMYLMATSQTNR